jgi:hypothetical protein
MTENLFHPKNSLITMMEPVEMDEVRETLQMEQPLISELDWQTTREQRTGKMSDFLDDSRYWREATE